MEQYHNILIIRLSSLGDVILTTPIIKLLKNKYPDSKIDFLVDYRYKNVLKTNPNLNEIFEYDKNKNQQTLINAFKKKQYDFVVDLQNNFRSREVTSKLGADKIRFHKPTLKKFLLVQFKWNRFKEIKSIPQIYADSIPQINFSSELPEVYLPEDFVPSVKPAGNFVGFAPGSKHFTKMWPAEYYIDLGRMLNEQGFTILLFGGKADEEICLKIHEKLADSIDLTTKDDPLQIARDMKECKVVVCNDSGLMHLAEAVNTPIVTIFGSTVREFGFYPYADNSVVVENENLKCRPCSHIGKSKCPKGHFKCMLDLTPSLVFNKIQYFIQNL